MTRTAPGGAPIDLAAGTGAGVRRLTDMDRHSDIWLVANPASGSNDRAALDALANRCDAAGLCLTRTIAFPEEELPTPAELDAAGIDTVAVFAGDGTVNALVNALSGWGGAVLVLPGGTMNLLAIRLHGERDCDAIVDALANGGMRRTRITTVECNEGSALAGLLVGPGTSWNGVREAMRQADLVGMVETAAEAVEESIDGSFVRSVEPPVGKPAGYPLLMLTPTERGIMVEGYHAETFGEYAAQGFAILKRNFREGPHDELGIIDELVLASADGGDLAMLIDGEPVSGSASNRFRTARCGVDLLAAADG